MPRILLADDAPTIRRLARAQLEAAGFEVDEAADGQEALAHAVAEPPDVVLLDIEMPVMNGYACLQALKAEPRTADIPVVFLTGRADATDLVRGLELGAHDYLRKPAESTELLARVNAALRVKQLQDTLRASAAEFDLVSRTDHLTGLHNRRHVDEQLRMLKSAARRHRLWLSLLLIDVDHFKAVNDVYGHQAGDEVLQELAARMRLELRDEDVLGRWGGEEFLVVLPHSPAREARLLAERLRRSVSASPFATKAATVSLTVSIGGAALVAPSDGALLCLADEQLYLAKATGRDQVHIAG